MDILPSELIYHIMTYLKYRDLILLYELDPSLKEESLKILQTRKIYNMKEDKDLLEWNGYDIPKGKDINVTYLSVIYGNVEIISKNIENLINLQKFYCYISRISEVHESIGNLINLVFLDLDNNYIKKIPDSIGNLINLRSLILGNNKLEEITDSICNLTNLVALSLQHNFLKKLPECIGNLKNLKRLYLSENKLTELPDSISSLYLDELYIKQNKNLLKVPKLNVKETYICDPHLKNLASNII